MIASRQDAARTGETIERFAEHAAHQVRLLWEQRFGSGFSESELENLTTAIWECVWEKTG